MYNPEQHSRCSGSTKELDEAGDVITAHDHRRASGDLLVYQVKS
jgi:hypothetical protein